VKKIVLRSYAKVNLYLDVLKRREDGFHEIRTIFERVSLFDTITLRLRREPRITVTSDSPSIPTDQSNLAYRSAEFLQKGFAPHRGVDIAIVKRIPVGSGLGGGSSNAATVLMGLNRLWRLHLTEKQLLEAARAIGSDVSFFIHDTPFGEGRGRGERVRALEVFPRLRLWHVLAVPKVAVSTPRIYKKWDTHPRLTKTKQNVKIIHLALYKADAGLLRQGLYNSLEQVTCALYPAVERVRAGLRSCGAESVLMSGSGSAVFALVSSRKEAAALCERVQASHRQWRVFAVNTR
jgi:4-diphosphocytidyl-2-C-methyl-D-erythritol kinase